jgi:hypothetical protein
MARFDCDFKRGLQNVFGALTIAAVMLLYKKYTTSPVTELKFAN